MVGVRLAHASGALRRGKAGSAGVRFTSEPSHGPPRPEPVRRAAHRVGARFLLVGFGGLLLGCGGGGGGDGAGDAADTTTTIVRTTAEEAPVAEGDCGVVPRLRVGGALDPATIDKVACTEPHDIEIGAVFDYPAGPDLEFPGSIGVDGYATDECLERFEPYVGTPYAESTLDVLIIAPDEDGWNDGDRRMACVLYHVDFQDLTQPVAGSGI